MGAVTLWTYYRYPNTIRQCFPVLCVYADGIKEADRQFKLVTGLDPSKLSMVFVRFPIKP